MICTGNNTQKPSRTAKITLLKVELDKSIDESTWKRVDATMGEASQRQQNAVMSDAQENNDGFLLEEYRDRWESRLRTRLKFCLVKRVAECLEFVNVQTYEPAYIFDLMVGDNFTVDDLRSIGKRMHEYIVRGATYDWYLRMGIEPTDNEQSIQQLEDDIVYALRGQAWGRRPMQPFGPAMFNYEKPII